MKFRNTFSSCMMRRIEKCHRGGFSEKTTNQAFLIGAKTALTIFLKLGRDQVLGEGKILASCMTSSFSYFGH